MTSSSPKSGLRLSDLDWRIGQTVQLITQGPQPHKHYTRLIGHAEPEFLMVRTPTENGWAVILEEGQALQFRAFCGVSLYEFETRVLTQLLHPRNYMLLACPSEIRETRLRSHERVACAMPVRLLQAPRLAELGPQAVFRLQDLSGSGAALVGPQVLGATGQTLQLALSFSLAATGTQEQVLLMADIQSVQAVRDAAGQPQGHVHGLRFHQIEPRVLLLVHELQRPGASAQARS